LRGTTGSGLETKAKRGSSVKETEVPRPLAGSSNISGSFEGSEWDVEYIIRQFIDKRYQVQITFYIALTSSLE
jgi:hypothetical protein